MYYHVAIFFGLINALWTFSICELDRAYQRPIEQTASSLHPLLRNQRLCRQSPPPALLLQIQMILLEFLRKLLAAIHFPTNVYYQHKRKLTK